MGLFDIYKKKQQQQKKKTSNFVGFFQRELLGSVALSHPGGDLEQSSSLSGLWYAPPRLSLADIPWLEKELLEPGIRLR